MSRPNHLEVSPIQGEDAADVQSFSEGNNGRIHKIQPIITILLQYQDISPQLLHPLIYWRTWAMTMLFGLLLLFVYWLLIGLPQLGLNDACDVGATHS